ncbi:putative reverse transcriptase domain-containing protein [Tanacetum coccineum]
MMVNKEDKVGRDVVTGTILDNYIPARVLYDSGTSVSFVSFEFSKKLSAPPNKLPFPLKVEIAGKEIIVVSKVYRDVEIEIDDSSFKIDFIPIALGVFDIVIGMDWLDRYNDNILCSQKLVRVVNPQGREIIIYGDKKKGKFKICSIMKARKYLSHGCHAFMAHVIDTSYEKKSVKDVPVVNEFLDVFPEDLPGIPPERQVEFRIDLIPGATPIHKTPYRLALSEMKELMFNSRILTRARVESSRDEESLGEDASKQGRINAIDADEDITLVNGQDDADMFDVNTLTGDEVLAEPEVAVKDVNLTVDEVTLAQALAALKSVKPKVKANVVEEPSVPVSAASTRVSAATTTTTVTIPTPRKGIVITELGTSITTTISLQPLQEKVLDKGKGIMVEEPVKSMKKKDLVRLDKEIPSKLQAEFDEEERLAREKDEANVALTEEWDDIQAKVDANYQLAQRLQAKKQEQFTTEQKATLFKELLEQRRNHFAAKRAEEKRNKPSTQAQQRKKSCPPSIVDWKIHKKGRNPLSKNNRTDGSSKMYLVFSHMLKSFDREDLETLWKLVKAKHGSTRPEEGYERVLWGDLKGRIVRIKRLLNDLRVIAAQLMLLVYKLLLLKD